MRNKNIQTKTTRLAIAGIGLALAVLPAQGQGLLESLTAAATPTDYTGPCPAVITFHATIKVNAAGSVKYHWLRSDAASAPIQHINFGKPGTYGVTTTWTLGGPGLTAYRGWEVLEIVSPFSARSNQANFTMSCQGNPNPHSFQPAPLSFRIDQSLRPSLPEVPALDAQPRPIGVLVGPAASLRNCSRAGAELF